MTTILVYLFDEIRAVRVVEEDAFKHPDISNEFYLWGVLQGPRIMEEFLKEKFTGHPKFHPQMVILSWRQWSLG